MKTKIERVKKQYLIFVLGRYREKEKILSNVIKGKMYII